MPSLQTALLDLLYEIRDTEIKLIIGGGFGIYLRMQYVRAAGSRTLFSVLPASRVTNDLDLFLRVELLINSEKLKPLAEILGRLGYKVVKGAEWYQFAKPGPTGSAAGGVKIDLLTGPRKSFTGSKLRVDERRVRPRPSIGIHAHPLDEVPTLEDKLLLVAFAGTLSTGSEWATDIFLPHPYSFLLMKLFAFRDRVHDKEKQFGQHHALDLYTVVGLTSEHEWAECREFTNTLKTNSVLMEAGKIVAEYFSGRDQLGLVRLQEHAYYQPNFEIDSFISVLRELFPET